MVTINQLVNKGRKRRPRYIRSKALLGCPQKKGICRKVYTVKPKKPNSAIRKVAKVQLSTGRSIILAIPGQGHRLQEYSVVLVRGGRIKDVPGVHYKAIKGKYDFPVTESIKRKNRRSKYGIAKESKGI